MGAVEQPSLPCGEEVDGIGLNGGLFIFVLSVVRTLGVEGRAPLELGQGLAERAPLLVLPAFVLGFVCTARGEIVIPLSSDVSV